MIARALLAWTLAAALPACADRPHAIRPFKTDGCSLFPDHALLQRTSWRDCCVTHDVAYWRGGTSDERARADEALRACVLARTGDPDLARTMYLGVRAGGAPAFPTWYRWGYGWELGRGYAPLDDAERRSADEAIARWERERSAAASPRE